VDDSTRPAVREEVGAELAALLEWVSDAAGLDLEAVEGTGRTRGLAVGGRRLEAGRAARGSGRDGPRRPCVGGGVAGDEGVRSKEGQTLVGWVRVRRAYYGCPACGQGRCPREAARGLGRASHRPGVRRAISRLGALLPFAQAATRADLAGVQTSASTARAVTAAVGTRRDQELVAAVAAAWRDGLPPPEAPAPPRLDGAMDGGRIRTAPGEGQEAQVGGVAPERPAPSGEWTRAPSSSAASFAPAADFGRRLALEAHRRGLEAAAAGVVLGDGAEWIWNLAAEPFPGATQVVDWYHASARIWELGRAHDGDGTATTQAWADRPLARLAAGQIRELVGAWRRRRCRGPAAAGRDEQVGYFTSQARRMAYDQYRARGLDIGRGIVESAGTALIGMRQTGPGMRWSGPGAQAVATVRVLRFNGQGAAYDLAA